jgi:hypothetical protein
MPCAGNEPTQSVASFSLIFHEARFPRGIFGMAGDGLQTTGQAAPPQPQTWAPATFCRAWFSQPNGSFRKGRTVPSTILPHSSSSRRCMNFGVAISS